MIYFYDNAGQEKARRTSPEDRNAILERFDASGLRVEDFAKSEDIKLTTLRWWLNERKKHSGKSYSQPRGKRGPYSPEEKKKTIEAYLSSGLTQLEFATLWGVGPSTLNGWLMRYDESGFDGLMRYAPAKSGDKRIGPKISPVVRNEIVVLKKNEPSFGFLKIKNWLFRFRGVKVSTGTIRKTVNEEGLPDARRKRRRKRSVDRIRRFERATAMQLWQSDITQLTLARTGTRVYLTVFMDDHSRFIVGWRLQTRQTSDLVIDTFKDAVSKFGKPEEVLTDQGRQYFAWRGKSDLEKLLEREGIKHVVSRSHHPQTLGKCERFWETIKNELWLRAKPQDLDEAKERLKYFIDHYNFHRPHQGLDGHCPADRFFGATQEIRTIIEKTVKQNALDLAIGELPKSPAFLIGQIGDQKIAFHGTTGNFIISHENIGEQNDRRTNSDISNESTRSRINIQNLPQKQSTLSTQESGQCEEEFSGNSGSRAVGSSVGGRSWTSAVPYNDNNGVLAGISKQEGDGRGIGNESPSIPPTDPTSDCGHVLGTSRTAIFSERFTVDERFGNQKTQEENSRT